MLHAKLKDFKIPALQKIETPQEYIPALLLYLLQQRAKISKGLLNPYLPKSLLNLWNELLRLLEAENRKVVSIRPGSLIICIFCPTESSLTNLIAEIDGRKFALLNSLERLLHEIGKRISLMLTYMNKVHSEQSHGEILITSILLLNLNLLIFSVCL